MKPEIEAFIALTGLFIIGLGWMSYAISASGAWDKRVMSNSHIKAVFKLALWLTLVGGILIAIPFIF